MALALISSIALATASYYAIERPLHTSPWFDPYPNPGKRRAAWHGWWERNRRSIVAGLAAGALIIPALFVASTTLTGDAAEAHRSAVEAAVAAQREDEEAYAALDEATRTPADRIAANLRAAMHADEWPPLEPATGAVLTDGNVEIPGCHPSFPADPASCAFGDPTQPQIVVFGDSLGATLLPTVTGAVGEEFFIRGLTRAMCPILPLDVNFPDEASRAECATFHEQALAYINETRPAVVLVIENYEWANRLNSHPSGTDLQAEWVAAGDAFVASIAASGAQVAFVTPPSMGLPIADCATAVSLPVDCVSTVDGNWPVLRDAESQIGGAHVIDTLHWFCTEQNFCPSFSDSVITKRDYLHPTRQYAANADVAAAHRNLLAAEGLITQG